MSQFKGLRVLELASVLAGPSVGQFFAELGADVLKVENLRIGGDVTRTWKSAGEQTDDRSAYFCSVNWGKRSIAIDLLLKEGQEIVHELAKHCDLVIASYKPGDAEKLKVDYATLSKLNPALIYGQVTGYGSHNSRVGYDAIVQAEAGFMFMNGEPGGSSLKMPVALIDVLAGHHLKEGMLVAMLEKINTGKGKLVEVSLIQAAIASLVNQGTNWLVNGKSPQKQGSTHPNIAPYGDLFKTKDGKELILAVGNDGQFTALCEILQLSILAHDNRFSTNAARVVNRAVLKEHLDLKICDWMAKGLIDQLNKRNIPAGIVQTVPEALSMPHAQSMLIENAGVKGVKSVIFEPESSNLPHFLPPPHFGEHTQAVLAEFLNISSEMHDNLKKMKAIQ